MRYLPVFLDVRNRRCLVVGVGALADEKAMALENAGARVRREESFDPGNSRDVFLIVTVTDNEETARAVKEFGDLHRIFVNVVDNTECCTFIVPAIVDRGNLLIAVSTCGKSPAMASAIRRELEGRYGPEYSEVLEILGGIRPKVKELLGRFDDRKAFYLELVSHDLPGLHRRFGAGAVQDLLQQQLSEIAK